jgi:glyceraldehyde 3-phosphate dehydrogenase
MTIRVAINGFGRIGRNILRAFHESNTKHDLQFVAINDLGDAKTNAHLLKYDTVHGRFKGTVEVGGNAMKVNGGDIQVVAERDPSKLPWKDLGVDIVLECTGLFTSKAKAGAHLAAGAKKVIISAPGDKDVDRTVVFGVNHQSLKGSDTVISNASCTTNCLAPVAKVLHGAVGIRHGVMTTIHAYTGDQRVVDLPHKDLRRARAAAINLIPTSTGAAKALGLVVPELAGKLLGYAVRVPVPTGSMVDLTVETERGTTVEEVNDVFRTHADSGPLAGILRYNDEPIVSSDVVKCRYSAVFDAPLTIVVDDTQVKVVAWYDNEWGYSNRLVELAVRVSEPADRPLTAPSAASR